jgi:hypothetical protein
MQFPINIVQKLCNYSHANYIAEQNTTHQAYTTERTQSERFFHLIEETVERVLQKNCRWRDEFGDKMFCLGFAGIWLDFVLGLFFQKHLSRQLL